MAKRPIIGIASAMDDSETRIRMNKAYFNAIFNAGGVPVFIPYDKGAEDAKRMLQSRIFDGILFSGGIDLDPKLYGEELTGEGVEICQHRDEFEMALFEGIKYTNMPILGICRGVQSMNVYFGGTLHQDMKGHRQENPGRETTYRTKVTPGTRFSEIVEGKSEIFVNSFHHQCVKAVAPGFVAAAVSEEGYVEAIEPIDRSRFILGVQWHPELFYNVNKDSNKIFAAFIEAAKKNMD